MSSRASQSVSDELEEIIYYITEMRRKVNLKMDDFFFIIEQQNKRIHEQNTVIDELAWQLRDLRDSVREINSRRNHCACNYENHLPSIQNSMRHKLEQLPKKNNLNKFADQSHTNDEDEFNDAGGDNDQDNNVLTFNENKNQTEDDLYEPIEYTNYTPRLNNLQKDQQNTRNYSNDNSFNSTNRGSLKKMLNNENNYDNKLKKVQYSKSCTNDKSFDPKTGFRKERGKARDAQSEQFSKSNISLAEEVNDDVILRRPVTMVANKSNRSSYRESSISAIMSDIEEENINDLFDKLKHEPRKSINYSDSKMRPFSFKTSI